MSNKTMFSNIDQINELLGNTQQIIDNNIGNLQNSNQEEIDKACIYVNNKLNPILAQKRQETINILKDKYTSSLEIVKLISPYAELLQGGVNTDTVVSAVSGLLDFLAEIYLGPYKTALDFTTDLAPKLIELSGNIAELQNLKINVADGYNTDKLDIHMDPITLNDIIS